MTKCLTVLVTRDIHVKISGHLYSVNKKNLLMKIVTTGNGLVQSFLTWGSFAPCSLQGYLAMSGDILVAMNGRRSLLVLVSRSQGCCYLSFDTQDSTHQPTDNYLAPNINNARIEKLSPTLLLFYQMLLMLIKLIHVCNKNPKYLT